jgi:hypothetical protein
VEGLLKTRIITKLHKERPSLIIMCYAESEIEKMKKDVNDLKEI